MNKYNIGSIICKIYYMQYNISIYMAKLSKFVCIYVCKYMFIYTYIYVPAHIYGKHLFLCICSPCKFVHMCKFFISVRLITVIQLHKRQTLLFLRDTKKYCRKLYLHQHFM